MSNPVAGYWDSFLFGIRKILSGGVELAQDRSRLNFIGANVADNPTLKCIDVEILGGLPSGTASGDLGGSYPNPIVQNLSGNDPTGGELDATANQVQWFPNLGANTGKGGAVSAIAYLQTIDDGEDVAALFDVPFVNSARRVDIVVNAVQKGASFSGVGSVIESWSGSAVYTKRSGAAVLLGHSISDPLVGGTTFAGPHFTTSGTNALINCDPGGSTTGTTYWIVNYTITLLESV
jgi:hypothetical protein